MAGVELFKDDIIVCYKEKYENKGIIIIYNYLVKPFSPRVLQCQVIVKIIL